MAVSHLCHSICAPDDEEDGEDDEDESGMLLHPQEISIFVHLLPLDLDINCESFSVIFRTVL